jgi:hypothetical protein
MPISNKLLKIIDYADWENGCPCVMKVVEGKKPLQTVFQLTVWNQNSPIYHLWRQFRIQWLKLFLHYNSLAVFYGISMHDARTALKQKQTELLSNPRQ